MATNKKSADVAQSADFAGQTEDIREEVLGDSAEAVVPGDNRELEAADTFVNTEKTLPAERNPAARVVVQNRTLTGMPADVHQVLVAASNQFRDEAALFDEVAALMDKYQGSDELSKEMRKDLEAAYMQLSTPASLYRMARLHLERNT